MKEKIENKIRELVPILMIDFGYSNTPSFVKPYAIGSMKPAYDKDGEPISEKDGIYYDNREHKIIGHPIELNHLLLAIESKNNMEFDEGNFYFNHGTLIIKFIDKDLSRVTGIINYNLFKTVSDNLDNPELVKFLSKIFNLK